MCKKLDGDKRNIIEIRQQKKDASFPIYQFPIFGAEGII
jgi:hypothetical protein